MGVLQNRCSEKFRKFYKKTIVPESLFNKKTIVRLFIKKQHFIKKERCYVKRLL